MSCTVVMSSYNGEKYIFQQLQSILKQTRQPENVLIFDDCSNDATCIIVEEFIRENQLKNWKLIKNVKNLGWKVNFWQGISKAEGEVVFLCDQDDIWKEDKIEKMMKIMESDHRIELLACGYLPIYEDKITRRISPKIVKDLKNQKEVRNIAMDEKWLYVTRPGCTYAVTKKLYYAANDIWDASYAHDATLWRSAILRGTAYVYDDNLICWRRYSASSSNPLTVKNQFESKIEWLYHDRMDTVDSHIQYLKGVLDYLEKNDNRKYYHLIKENLDFKNAYKKALLNSSTMDMLKTALKYRKFYYTYKSIMYDIGLTICSRFKCKQINKEGSV